ncbi:MULTISPECIES: ADP-ribosyltransferase [Photorhabdus]|nr:ADP-ribosyltransferase [Photorhabdus asymbiotica]RKS54106.1 ADP-ribosyltransferase exoenzyme [Photorhabdus asymbiotica]
MFRANQSHTTSQRPAASIVTQMEQVPSVTTSRGSNQPTLINQPAKMPPLQQAIEEFNKAVMRAAKYEGSVENIIRDKVNRLFPTADKALKEKVVAQSVEKVAEANQAFEFNHLGNDLLEFPAVEYMSRSFVRRVLEHLAIAQAKDPSLTVPKTNEDAGIGFLQGWSNDDVAWAKQLNAVLNESKINARVLTTLAYSHIRPFRDPALLRKMGDAINQQLLTDKESHPRLDIFQGHSANSEPKFAKPITTQPHGWPWLKYADWNTAEALGNKTHIDLIGSRQNGDPHKGTGFKFQGMQQAIKPTPYRRNSFSLSERSEHESGYGGFVINDKSLTSIDTDQPISVNWRQQNMDKKLPMFSGPSSTTSYMYEIARLLNLPAYEAQLFRALLLGWMIQARDHSFTEIMGALDAYAMESNQHGPAVVDSDEKMAWHARQTGDWLSAYESLVTEDINLPAMEAKTIILNGQEIHLPALEPVKIDQKTFDQFITQGKGYPSQYGSDDSLLKLGQAIQLGQEAEDEAGLASEKILYAPQDMETLKLYNPQKRVLPVRPERTEPGTPLLDATKDEKVTKWLDELPPERRAFLLNSAASLLAESTQQDSLSNVFHYGGRNDVWETFLTVKETNMLAEKLKLDSLQSGEKPFIHLLDLAAAKNTPQERKATILTAIGGLKDNQDVLIKGMMLAVTRFYTANGANVINPGYGDFAPPKNDEEREIRLQSLLKRNQYRTSTQRTQAKNEYNQTVELLRSALESPMFERYSGKVWHGSHVAVADAILEKRTGAKFPGFMSTTYDPNVAQSYMDKGALLVVKAAEVNGSIVEGISNAPNEKEVLFPADTSFKVEQSYTMHLKKDYPPTHQSMMKRRMFDLEVAKGQRQPYVTMRVTTPEMDQLGQTDRSNLAGGRELKELIAHIEKNGPSMDTDKIKVVVMIPENRTEPQKKRVSDRAIHAGFDYQEKGLAVEENEKQAKRVTKKPQALLAAR